MSQMIVVKNNLPKPIAYGARLPGQTPVVKQRMLQPGANEVDAEEFEAATKKSPVWAQWKADKSIEITKAKGGEGETLKSLSPEEAKNLITETFDRELLASWLDNESRADVKKSIRKRDEFLEAEFKRRVGGEKAE